MPANYEEQEILKKIRRIFANRTHKQPKITVVVEKDQQKYRTIIAPYEPTIDKLLALISNISIQSRISELKTYLHDSHKNPGHDWNYVEDRIAELEAQLKETK